MWYVEVLIFSLVEIIGRIYFSVTDVCDLRNERQLHVG